MHDQITDPRESSEVQTDDTQPIKIKGSETKISTRILVGVIITVTLAFLSLSVFIGAALGYRSAMETRSRIETAQLNQILGDQFDLAIQDMNQGRYVIAQQRLEFILGKNPGYPGLPEKIAAIISILNATATPTPVPPTYTPTPTITLTPTRDLRGAQERLLQSMNLMVNGDWATALENLLSLRRDEPGFQIAHTDGLIYLVLRNRGVNRILQGNNLEGGIYDLSLVEQFGPLDFEAEGARNLARLYLIGSSFWEVLPERAVYYFSQLASAAPYLRDASGWTAMERYRGALIQYGDQFANLGDWCQALTQYQLAVAIRSDKSLEDKIQKATESCFPPTPEYTVVVSYTPTFSPTPTGVTFTPGPPTASPTIIPPTNTPVPPTLQPTTPSPGDTPSPTQTPIPTETLPTTPPVETPQPPG